ncbi:hypothetical protein SCLARK_001550 [Spiroplasma clarkii]|uniref:hypothetical protein n=1 Tax=Spiroplasma clarkii TaxID=2139 RepID=UPI000B58373B|nr:hypothetical protein [Spiroplasma clarkii]ARU92054.1 hypothetical protein SCLARK_001550 [Spiroplasma clarkii]
MEFNAYLDVIGDYLDVTFFENSAITEKLTQYAEQSERNLDMKFFVKTDVDLSVNQLNDYMLNCKRALEKALYGDWTTFKFYIFAEVKSIVRYYLEKTYEYEALMDFETLYGIKTIEFHQQNETFKYLYSVFDKFTYIARYLNDRYVKNQKNDLNELTLKFYNDFVNYINFLTKDEEANNVLKSTLDKITSSKAWHFIRRLRNNLEHDFSNPSRKYNISFSLQLLFIIIGRIMLVLRKTLKTDLEMKQIFEVLKNKEK